MAYDQANPFGASSSGSSPYDPLRKKAVETSQASGQQGLDAMTRRYAAMGNLNSGSYTQAIAQGSRDTAQRQQDALGNIDVAEQQGSLPYAQMAQQKGQFGQSLAEQQAARGQQASQFSQELPLKSRQLDLEASQQGMDQKANDVNARFGEFQMNHSGGVFGGGGILGLGIGDSVNNSGFGSFHL